MMMNIPIRLKSLASLFSRQNNTHYRTIKTSTITNSPKQQTLSAFRKSIGNQSDVSLSLAKHVISTTNANDKNLVFSPLSIHVVLGLIAAGSNGPTRNQILRFFKSKSAEDLNFLSSQLVTRLFADGQGLGGPCLSSANGVWVDQSLVLKPSYKDVVEKSYMAATNNVDFQTKADNVREEVNLWAEKQTNGLIKNVLSPGSVDSLTRLIFANALYFKGEWYQEFDASETKHHKFFLLNGKSVRVPFMTSSYKDHRYISVFDGFKVLRLPYKQGKDEREFSMYFFLPNDKYGLPSLLKTVGSESKFIERHLPSLEVRIGDFLIPKFKINFDFEASDVLKGLGLTLPFSTKKASLTEMVEHSENLFVSSIFQKSFIEVNEKGTEAAAVTSLWCRAGGFRVEPTVDFVADHPFLFVIREDTTGAVLFVGQVLNPLEE